MTGSAHRDVVHIPDDRYREITGVLPILCVDVIVRNPLGEVLLLQRANEPRRGQWWVVGGRVLRNETLEAAAARQVRRELGVAPGTVRAIGYYEEIAADGIYGPQHGTHGVSVVFETTIENEAPVTLDSQSLAWRFAPQLPEDFRIQPFEARR